MKVVTRDHQPCFVCNLCGEDIQFGDGVSYEQAVPHEFELAVAHRACIEHAPEAVSPWRPVVERLTGWIDELRTTYGKPPSWTPVGEVKDGAYQSLNPWLPYGETPKGYPINFAVREGEYPISETEALASQDGGLIVPRCCYCGGKHEHGGAWGHRVAHCHSRVSHQGYVLQPSPAWFMKNAYEEATTDWQLAGMPAGALEEHVVSTHQAWSKAQDNEEFTFWGRPDLPLSVEDAREDRARASSRAKLQRTKAK